MPTIKAFPPTLSIHGTDDTLVPYDREAPIQEALKEAGVSHRLITLEGQGHTPLGQYCAFIGDIIAWLEIGREKTEHSEAK